MASRFDILHLPAPLRSGGWRPVLRRWGQLLDEYASGRGGARDHAYWYGERPLTGLLAAAAWSTRGGWALEEFSSPRSGGVRRRIGRGDLWLGTGRGVFTVEAKIAWPSLSAAPGESCVTRQLAAAKRQLRSLDGQYRCGRLVAVCFVVPHLTQAAVRRGSVTELMGVLPARFARDPYAVAVHRPGGRLPAFAGRVYPGVVLVAEVL